MIFELNQCRQAVAPWELVITLDGVRYPTRRPDLGTLAVLLNAGATGGGQMAATAEKIFAADAPSREGWAVEDLMMAVSAYIAYFSESAVKNFPAIAESVATAIAKARIRASSSQTGS
jgi:hypothetical protein